MKVFKNGVVLVAALGMAAVVGWAEAEPVKLEGTISTVLSASHIEIDLVKPGSKQAASAKIGDKVRLFAPKAVGTGGATAWTVKHVNGSLLLAVSDESGETPDESLVGRKILILSEQKEQETVADKPAKQSTSEDVAKSVPEGVADNPTQKLILPEKSQQRTANTQGADAKAVETPEVTSQPEQSEPVETAGAEAKPAALAPKISEEAEKPEDQMAEKQPAPAKMVEKAETAQKPETEAAPVTGPQKMPTQAEKSPAQQAAPTAQTEPEMAKTEVEVPQPEQAKADTAEAEAAPQDAAKAEGAQLEPTQQVAVPDMGETCDRLAAHPHDPEATQPGIRYGDMKAKDIIKACQAAIKQHPDNGRYYAQLTRGLHKAGMLENAAKTAQKGAELGSGYAMALVGVIHRQGIGVAKDEEVALSWFVKAAEAGNPGGMIFAAASFRDGKGAKRDHKRAADLYLKAADFGIAEAKANLAIFYDRGQGLKKNAKQAAIHMLEAFREGDKSAQKILLNTPTLLSLSARKAIQSRLAAGGFYQGRVDGQLGSKSKRALRAYGAAKPAREQAEPTEQTGAIKAPETSDAPQTTKAKAEAGAQ